MSEWWEGLSLLQKLFYCAAVPSTIVMLIQTVMLIFGLGGHDGVASGGPIEGGVGHDLPHDAVVGGHSTLGHAGTFASHDAVASSGTAQDTAAAAGTADQADAAAFHLFSLRSILAFFVVFGWVGIAMAADNLMPAVVISLVAFVAGVAALFVTAWMFYAIQKLQYSGNVHFSNAVGLQAEVYIPVPAERKGVGKVNVMLQGRWLECDAVTLGVESLKTQQTVRVVDVQNGSVLVVEPVGIITDK